MADFEFTSEEREVVNTLLKQFHSDVKYWQPGMSNERADTVHKHNDMLRRVLISAIEAVINEGTEQDGETKD